MIEPGWILLGGVLPACIAAMVLLTMSRPWRCPAGTRVGIGWTLSIACGFVVGYVATKGTWTFPPVEAEHWLVMVVVPAAALAALVAEIPASPASVRWALRAIVAGGAAPVMLLTYLHYYWNVREAVAWLVALGAATCAMWSLTHRLAVRRPGRTVPVVMLIVTIGTGMTIMLSDSQRIAQITLTLGAALAGSLAASFFLPPRLGTPGAAGVTVVALCGLWMTFWFYVQNEPETVDAVMLMLLVLAIPAAWSVELPLVRRLKGWKTEAIRLAAVFVPVIAAIILAALQFSREMSQSGPGY